MFLHQLWNFQDSDLYFADRAICVAYRNDIYVDNVLLKCETDPSTAK